ncbi:MAG: F0F1 ATP synthase subunit A [Planctomycetes bacterium]|nr:F0F1 ATP synthase subunit A [Planctomycetota bacterium]
MTQGSENLFETRVVFHIGPVPVSQDVVTTWGIILVLGVGCFLTTRNLSLRQGRWRSLVEAIVVAMRNQIQDVIKRDATPFLPLLGTLFVFIAAANLSVLVPGVKPPTARVETPAALAAIVFLSAHYFGIRARGVWQHLRSYARPNVLLLPLNVLSEFTRTFSLVVRLFGNIMSHEIIVGIVVALAGLFVPIPFMALGILIGLIQAYIFAVLATVFVGAAIGAVEQA